MPHLSIDELTLDVFNSEEIRNVVHRFQLQDPLVGDVQLVMKLPADGKICPPEYEEYIDIPYNGKDLKVFLKSVNRVMESGISNVVEYKHLSAVRIIPYTVNATSSVYEGVVWWWMCARGDQPGLLPMLAGEPVDESAITHGIFYLEFQYEGKRVRIVPVSTELNEDYYCCATFLIVRG